MRKIVPMLNGKIMITDTVKDGVLSVVDLTKNDAIIHFDDNTVIHAHCEKKSPGCLIQHIFVENEGKVGGTISSEMYSDSFTINENVALVSVVKRLSVTEFYNKLVEVVRKANAAYYDLDEPIMTDLRYDQLMQRVEVIEDYFPELITANSPTKKVGGNAMFAKVEHKVPMQSLLDVFSEEDVMKFVDTYPDALFTVEEKIDGLSMSVTYKDGVYLRAETRGDGLIGEDVTHAISYINGIYPFLNTINIDNELSKLDELEVRCEVYLPVERFLKLNEEREREGKKLFANPRNAAAGILRNKDIKEIKKAGLCAFAFQVQRYTCREPFEKIEQLENQHCSLMTLSSLGFNTVPYYLSNAGDVLTYIDIIGNKKGHLPYWIDGAVVKINDFALREKIGVTSKYPKWAVAYKYPPEEKETVVKDIVLQTGRTGRVTPVAILEPVYLAGTKVEKATLNTPKFIKSLGVNIGDTVLVRKAAEIIPEIIKVVKSHSNTAYDMLDKRCPSCGHSLRSDEQGEGAFCPNQECPAQFSKRIEFWCSRDCMNIMGMGPAVVDKLISVGVLNSIPDIYKIKDKETLIVNNGHLGKKTFDNLVKSIEKSKENNIDRLIKALGILGVGRSIGKTLAENYGNMDEISRLTEYQLSQIEGIGNVSSMAMFEWFNESEHEDMLEELKSLGVNMKSLTYGKTPFDESGAELLGLTFVITGTLETLKRDEVARLIEENGGKVSGSVSKKTDYLIAGDNAGSKFDKAKVLGIKIISEKDFLEMINRK